MKSTLSLRGQQFLFRCQFRDRHKARLAGFKWHPKHSCWYTEDLSVAAKLRAYATESAEETLRQKLIQISPWPMPLPVPPPGLTFLSFQPEVIRFALERNRSYLGLPPGMGKTIIAAAIADAQWLLWPVTYISPPFLVENVREEFRKWAPDCHPLIVPDTMLDDGFTRELLPAGGLLIVDEAHRFKNPLAKRTKALLGSKSYPGLVELFQKHVFMSGTPMPNRPMELFALLSKMAPETIGGMNQWQYGKRYCGGFRNRWGWDFSGASNLPELRRKVVAPSGPFMLRLKKDLLGLPPLVEEVFVISDTMSPELKRMDRELDAAYSSAKDLIKHQLAIKAGVAKEKLHTATYRRLLGMQKVDAAVEYVESILDESDESVLLIAYHKEVIAALAKRLTFYRPFVITGDTPRAERFQIVKAFQNDTKRRLMVGNYLAMGIGFTITKAQRGILLEYSWVPGENRQVLDRMHRHGQRGTVVGQYLCFKNSIDKKVIEDLLKKRKATEYI